MILGMTIAPPVDDIGKVTASWPLRTHLDFPPQPSSVPQARRFARLILVEWALPGLVDNVQLVVSEMVTNALDHAIPAPVHLWLCCDHTSIMAMVGDSSPAPPQRLAQDTGAIGGRGLAIVHEVTGGHWGWFPLMGGKAVWALCSGNGPQGTGL
jgi:anti-sigma regulatory factor (Ser/Thr protein kinase)